MELYLERIGSLNGLINAVVAVDPEGARRAAARVDADLAKGRAIGPLAGLPITLKEGISVKGLPWTGGLTSRAGRLARTDAPLVRRLRAAGSIILGKTNIPELSRGIQCCNDVYGCTRNPWDVALTPGGSSGGPAAAVAAGLSALDIGTDAGGSIRLPAAFCGVYGHKASHGAVPTDGYALESEFGAPPTSVFSCPGPIARSAADLDLALGAIVAPSSLDDRAWSIRLPAPRHRDPRGWRVAVLAIPPWHPIDDEIAAGLDRLVAFLRGSGARVETATPDLLGDLREFHKLRVRLSAALEIPRSERRGLEARLRATGDEFDAARADGLNARGQHLAAWFIQRQRYRRAFQRFFRSWDVLVAPVINVLPFPSSREKFWSAMNAAELLDPPAFEVGGRKVPYWLLSVFASIANVTGHPATAFPVCIGRSGLPVGLQAIGPYLEDRTPIAFASFLEREFAGFSPPPGFGTD